MIDASTILIADVDKEEHTVHMRDTCVGLNRARTMRQMIKTALAVILMTVSAAGSVAAAPSAQDLQAIRDAFAGRTKPNTEDGMAAGMAAANRGDFATAMRLWRPLADQGDAAAQYNLGLMYNNGDGVTQDYTEAVKWFRLAADQSVVDAQMYLGFIYSNGLGMPQDFVQAHKWYNLAVSRYPASQKAARDQAVENRDTVAAKMTPAQIAEAQELAREWKPK